MTLDVLGVVTLSGSLGFELGPTDRGHPRRRDRPRSSRSSRSARPTSTASSASTAPTSHDSNGNGYIDRRDFEIEPGRDRSVLRSPSTTASAAAPRRSGSRSTTSTSGIFVGLEVDTAPAAARPPSLGVYVAGLIDIDSFGFVGIDGLTAVGSLGAAFNVGASTSGGFSAIDFVTSFPADGDAGGDSAGYEVFTGDRNNPILLGFDDFLFELQLVGAISLADTFRARRPVQPRDRQPGTEAARRRPDGDRARPVVVQPDHRARSPPRARRCSRSPRSAPS